MAFFKSFTFYIILTLVVLLGIAGWLYKGELESHATTKSELMRLEQSVATVKAQYEKEKLDHAQLRQQKADTQKGFREIKSALDGMKNRQDTIRKRPGLVELKIKKSFDVYMNDLQCETGAEEKC